MRILLTFMFVLFNTYPAQAGILYQTDFETAVVPLDPNNFNLPGFFGAPAGWSLARTGANRTPGHSFQPMGTVMPDECYHVDKAFVNSVGDDPGFTPFSGNKALRIQYSLSNPEFPGNPSTYAECGFCLGNDCELPNLATGIPDLTEFWVRAWMRPHNYGINPIGSNKIIYMKNSGVASVQDAFAVLMQMFTNPGVLPGFFVQSVDCGSPNDSGASCEPAFCNPPQAGVNASFVANCNAGWGGPPNQGQPVMQQDVWQCVEAQYKMNSVIGGVAQADSEMRTWVNGVLTMQYTGFVFRAAASNAKFRAFHIYRQGARVGSVMYWDDIAIGDARIGCGSIPPSAPSNLIITSIFVLGAGAIVGRNHMKKKKGA